MCTDIYEYSNIIMSLIQSPNIASYIDTPASWIYFIDSMITQSLIKRINIKYFESVKKLLLCFRRQSFEFFLKFSVENIRHWSII